jgi:hypothetical protein
MMTSEVWVVVATHAQRHVCEPSSCVLRDWRRPISATGGTPERHSRASLDGHALQEISGRTKGERPESSRSPKIDQIPSSKLHDVERLE